MKNQPRKREWAKSRIENLIQNYPALGLLRYEWRWRKNKGQRWQYPKMNVHVQIADPNSMHLQARNVDYFGGAYVVGENNLRGTRLESMSAVSGDDQVMANLKWEKGDCEKMSKDIFKIVDPNRVSYLMWVQVIIWYEPASKRREKKLGIHFGLEVVGIEVDVCIFRRPRDKSFLELIEIADREKKERENAYLHFPKEQPEFPAIHKMLKDGQKLHAFSSGGGLRVVRFPSCGYGEHPNIEEALNHLEEDCLAGGRSYREVYGKLHTHYLTGATIASSNLDLWIRQGNTFDCWQEGDEVVFKLNGYAFYELPNEILKSVQEERIEVGWCDLRRGFEYKSRPSKFANGSIGCSTEVISGPDGRDPFMFEITKTGRGVDFWDALRKAFVAEEVEFIKKP